MHGADGHVGGQRQFKILGPLEVSVGTVPLPLGPFKQRVVLAMLLCNVNNIVALDTLIEALWSDGLPRTAVKNLQVYISTLRRMLLPPGDGNRLKYRIRGYELHLEACELDVLRFEELARIGRLALRQGKLMDASKPLGEAVGMWNGHALADLLAVAPIRAEATRLENRRLAVHEDWIEAQLGLGETAQVLDELEDLIPRQPLRERLRNAQMLALYRSGRQAEAFAVYEDLRQLLARDLGLAPSGALSRLYEEMLAGAPSLDGPYTRETVQVTNDTVGHLEQLPRDVEDFTGRRAATDALLTAFAEPGPHGRLAVVSGAPGSGKTALAVHVAHLLRRQFADGQLLIRLRTSLGKPRQTSDILAELLRTFGADTEIPRREDERAALFRGYIAGLNMLLILDDAPDEAHVRPLLPGVGGFGVLVTSLRHLSGLEAARHVRLAPFDAGNGLDLLTKIIGKDRIESDMPSALRIVCASGMQPLAIRICGAKLEIHQHMPLSHFADRLEDEDQLLDELSVGDLTIRSLSAAYGRALEPGDIDAYLRLGMLKSDLFSLHDFGEIVELSDKEAESLLYRLIEAHVVGIVPGSEPALRYEVAKWLRLYTRERLAMRQPSH